MTTPTHSPTETVKVTSKEKPLVMISGKQFHQLHTQMAGFDGKFTPEGLGTPRVPLYEKCPICGKDFA